MVPRAESFSSGFHQWMSPNNEQIPVISLYLMLAADGHRNYLPGTTVPPNGDPGPHNLLQFNCLLRVVRGFLWDGIMQIYSHPLNSLNMKCSFRIFCYLNFNLKYNWASFRSVFYKCQCLKPNLLYLLFQTMFTV